MAAVFEPFVTELRALIVATWTDVPTGGVFENENLMLVPWDDVTPPIANMMIPEMPVSQDWGFANDVHQGVITLAWIGETTGDGTNQRAKVEALRDALLTASFTNANVIDVVSVDWSDAVPVNHMFLERGAMTRAGLVRANVIVKAST